jgi:hypothetical protein
VRTRIEKIEQPTLPQVKIGVKFCPKMRGLKGNKKDKRNEIGSGEWESAGRVGERESGSAG